MRTFSIFAALGCGIALSIGAIDTAQAQSPGGTSNPEFGGRPAPGSNGGDVRPIEARRDTSGSRISSNRRARQQAEAPASASEIRAAADAQLAAGGLTCDVSEAIQPGQSGGADVYEVACANSSGYLLVASTPPQSFDCLELAGAAARARESDPQADVGQQCSLPANLDANGIIGAWARQAGVDCNIDQAQAVGRNGATLVYEVGCANSQGYWLERANNAFTATPCLQITAQGGSCRFTTAAEIATSFGARLAGTDASACQVEQVRMMGENPNGAFYEAKCEAGNGFIARVKDEKVEEVYPCETAQRIGGGCTLTQVAAAPAAAPAATQQN